MFQVHKMTMWTTWQRFKIGKTIPKRWWVRWSNLSEFCFVFGTSVWVDLKPNYKIVWSSNRKWSPSPNLSSFPRLPFFTLCKVLHCCAVKPTSLLSPIVLLLPFLFLFSLKRFENRASTQIVDFIWGEEIVAEPVSFSSKLSWPTNVLLMLVKLSWLKVIVTIFHHHNFRKETPLTSICSNGRWRFQPNAPNVESNSQGCFKNDCCSSE